MAYLAVRHPSWFSKSLELSNYVTSSLPGIVVGLAFVTVSIRLVPGVYQTAGVLVAAYVLLFLPRALVNLRAGLAQAPKELDEAAQALGKPPLLSFIQVTLRLTAPGSRRWCRPGLPRHRQRTHGHAAAVPQRNPHAGHRVLEQEQRD